MIVDIKIPRPGESINEVLLAQWLKSDGSYVDNDEIILVIESEKVTIEIPAECAGILNIIIVEGETVSVGTVVGTIDTSGVSSKIKTKVMKTKTETNNVTESNSNNKNLGDQYADGIPSPAAKKLSKEKGIDLEHIQGSGKDGRITKQDLINHDKAFYEIPTVTTSLSKKMTNQPINHNRKITIKKLTPLRKKLATRLVSVKNETAMLTTFNEIDMSIVIEMRNKYKDQFMETHGIKLGFMSFFTKAVVNSLKRFPNLNAYITDDSLEYHEYFDIGIAVNTPKGLVVPVIRNAELLTMPEIEQEIWRLAKKSRNLSLSIDEMSGGTFTISNGGVFGSLMSTPILNPPQSGVLGMHNIVERPIAIKGKVEIHPMMYVALSYDHRIVDGKESVSFLISIKKLIEEPFKLFLDL